MSPARWPTSSPSRPASGSAGAPRATRPRPTTLVWSVRRSHRSLTLPAVRRGIVPNERFPAKKAGGAKGNEKPEKNHEKCDEPSENEKGSDVKPPEKVLKVEKPEDAAKAEPEDLVEVRTGVIHKYPYHEVEPERQRYPDERLYLAAKRDHEAASSSPRPHSTRRSATTSSPPAAETPRWRGPPP